MPVRARRDKQTNQSNLHNTTMLQIIKNDVCDNDVPFNIKCIFFVSPE